MADENLSFGSDDLTWDSENLLWLLGVDGELPNIFDRLVNGDINLDGRELPVETQAVYTLTLSAAPAQFSPNGSTTITVLAKKNGLPLPGVSITSATTNAAVGLVPGPEPTSTDGKMIYAIIGLATGQATISATMTVDGVTTASNSVVITVTQVEIPENYNMTGWGRVVLTVESPLANAIHPRPVRLSHGEQKRKYGDDMGLEFASFFENADVVFMPKFLLQ